METLALSFKAFCVHRLPAAGLSTLLQGLFPAASGAWALLATLLALAQREGQRCWVSQAPLLGKPLESWLPNGCLC